MKSRSKNLIQTLIPFDPSKSKRGKVDDVIICIMCGKETPLRAPSKKQQKYCPKCSAKADSIRKEKWRQKKGYKKSYDIEERKSKRRRCREFGLRINRSIRRDKDWINDVYNFRKEIRVTMPFTFILSKNAIYRPRAGGHVYLREQVKQARNQLALLIRAASSRCGIEWYEGKVWIDILVQKPGHQGDAVNVIDTVMDAITDAIGIDDRWFCIRRLDWDIVKEEPEIIVGIAQEVTEHHRPCSYCGRILPLNKFTKNRNDRLGVGRECKDCRKGE